MKSIICYSLLFLSLLSCEKDEPDAIADMEVTVSGNTVTVYNNSRLCLSEYDIDWGWSSAVKERYQSPVATNRYAPLSVDKSYSITLTAYNFQHKPSTTRVTVTIKKAL